MRTVASYIASMRHALGKTPAPGHNLYDSFNAAGSILFTETEFEFQTRGPVKIAAVAGQDYLELPSDFDQMLNIWVPNTGSFTQVQPVGREEMAQLRSQATLVTVGGTLYVCFAGNDDARTDPPSPRALCYPTPTANGSPTIQLIYLRRWMPVTPADNAKGAGIPEKFEHALNLCARATVCLIENQTAPIEQAAYRTEIDRLKSMDTRQPSDGRMRGGANERNGVPVVNIGFATL